MSYGYDTFGRLESLASPDLAATYAYPPGSSLIAGIAHQSTGGTGGPLATASRSYDALDRLQSIAYTAGASSTSGGLISFTYKAFGSIKNSQINSKINSKIEN